jgi:O-antigen ligase
MIHLILLLAIYIWPFGQLLAFTIPGIPFTVYLLDIVMILLTFSLLVSSKRKAIFQTSLSKPLFIFWGVAALSLLVNLRQGIASGLPQTLLYLLRLFIYPSLYFAGNHVGFQKIKTPVIISIIIISLTGLLQYLFFPDMRFLKNLGFDDHYYRLIGSFYDPNFIGAVFCGLSLYFLSSKKYLFSLPLIGLLAFTFSRASYLAFAIGLFYILFTQKKVKMLLLILLLGLIVYLIPKPFGEGVNLARTFSIFSRLDSWRQGITLFIQRPFLGWGYNTLRNVDGSRFQIDNSFIYILATTGLIGFLAFVNLMRKGFMYSTLAVKTLLISLFVHALFNNSLFYIWIMALLWFVLSFDSENSKACKSI